jgi:hypothetical protein
MSVFMAMLPITKRTEYMKLSNRRLLETTAKIKVIFTEEATADKSQEILATVQFGTICLSVYI